MDLESTSNSLFQSIDKIQAPQGSKLQHVIADLESKLINWLTHKLSFVEQILISNQVFLATA